MRNGIPSAATVAALVCAAGAAFGQAPVSSAFTYQGKLEDAGSPANAAYDMTFRLYSAAAGGSQVGSTLTQNDVPVSEGLFTVLLDFGTSPFGGEARWLEIAVRNGASSGAYTTLSPRQALTALPYALYALSGPGSGGPWAVSGNDITATNTGNVGIGVGNPAIKLSVFGSENTGLSDGVFEMISPGGALGNVMTMDGNEINAWSHLYINPDASTNVYMVLGGGDVGIGTAAPEALLHVADGSAGTVTAHGDSVAVFERSDRAFVSLLTPSTTDRGILFGDPTNPYDGGIVYNASPNTDGFQFRTGGNVNRMVITSSGNVGIGTTAPAAKLDVNGTARCTVLEITGADVAEKFPVSEPVEPGTVVMIDAENPGRLCAARGAYNRRVAGIVSGAGDLPVGAVLGHLPGHEDAPPIALSGRVWVRCDASDRAIEPGDMLTTADRRGHAMAAVDLPRAQGAILGKAMTALPHGSTGLVLVLVNLQ